MKFHAHNSAIPNMHFTGVFIAAMILATNASTQVCVHRNTYVSERSLRARGLMDVYLFNLSNSSFEITKAVPCLVPFGKLTLSEISVHLFISSDATAP